VNEFGRKPAPKPGFYRNVPFDEYAAWDAVNSHILTSLLHGTPAHVRHQLMSGGPEPTRSLDLGWLVHQAVLEPDLFAGFGADMVVPPKVDRRTTEGKRLWAEFQAANEGQRIVDADDYEKTCALRRKVIAIRESVLAHPSAGEFFRGPGANEVSLVWEERAAGVLCKARIDRVGMLGEWPIVGDLKTARKAARRPFERAVFDYGYHVQAQHYLAGLQALSPIAQGQPFRRFCFFVVETEAPFCPAVYEVDDSALAVAEQDRRRLLVTWRECVESGKWPGYADGVDLISLPAWAMKAMGEAA
jgi:hypothetical protein